jgi:nucleotide-binding universal stress UspA family protein
MIRPHVRELASRFQANVILIRVIELSLTSFIGEDFASFNQKDLDAIFKESQAYLDGVASKLRKKSIACKTLITYGPVVDKIIETANTEDADLIAMTSHGYGGLTRIFYGSVAAGILNRIDRPLFIVRSRWAE